MILAHYTTKFFQVCTRPCACTVPVWPTGPAQHYGRRHAAVCSIRPVAGLMKQTAAVLIEHTCSRSVQSDLWQVVSVRPVAGLMEQTAAVLIEHTCNRSVQSDWWQIWLNRTVAGLTEQTCSSSFQQTCSRADRKDLPQVWQNRYAGGLFWQTAVGLTEHNSSIPALQDL